MTLNLITTISRESYLISKFLSIHGSIYAIIYIADKIVVIESSLFLKVDLSR